MPQAKSAANHVIPGTLLDIGGLQSLAVDDNALYAGALMQSRTTQGKDRRMAAVVAHSVLNNRNHRSTG